MSDLPDLDEEELLRRLPEIERIHDFQLREKVINVFLEDCPDYFWTVPASSSGKYHPQDHTGKHGLWLHTKRAFVCFERLADSYFEAGDLIGKDLDHGRAAILLHDIFKQGLPPRDDCHTVSNHDVIAHNHLQQNTELPEEILGCVVSHNGPWGNGREPETTLEQVHHSADMIGSGKKCFFRVHQPCREIQKIMYQPERLE